MPLKPTKPNGLLATEILSKTPPRTIGGARFVVIESAEPKMLKGGLAALKCRTYSTHDLDGKPKKKQDKYQTVVYATEPGVRLHASKLKVACSCPDHVFWGGEYALWKKGAADLKYGNGDPPSDRNPRLTPWACKHTARVLRQIINKKV